MKAWEVLYRCSHETLLALRREVLAEISSDFKRQQKVPQKITATSHAKSWFKAYLSVHAETMPDGKTRSVYHLPSWMNREMVYNDYIAELNCGRLDGKNYISFPGMRVCALSNFVLKRQNCSCESFLIPENEILFTFRCLASLSRAK